MSRFTTLLRQDFVLAWRNGHIGVVIAIALTAWVVVIYVSMRDYVPEEMTGESSPELTDEPQPVNAPR